MICSGSPHKPNGAPVPAPASPASQHPPTGVVTSPYRAASTDPARKASSVVDSAGIITDAFCEHLLAVAMQRARRLGLIGDAAEDHALRFLAYMLPPSRDPPPA